MNEEGIRKRIRTLLEEIHEEADPVILNRCRSIFRQEVSFFHRSYMAAYLLLLAEEGKAAVVSSPASRNETGKGRDRSGRRDRNREGSRDRSGGRDKNRGRERPAEAVPVLSEDESVKLFISAGRNRKVFAREILALVNAKAKVARDDIGTIRILDNYSFIQVRTAAAEAVIAALHGQSFRGRILTVNYARRREEDEESGLSPSDIESGDTED
ncbi:RNA-binding protein [Spirochaetia bacterium]|nr:RNA-binding protein [Spirochaetia bacterium]